MQRVVTRVEKESRDVKYRGVERVGMCESRDVRESRCEESRDVKRVECRNVKRVEMWRESACERVEM